MAMLETEDFDSLWDALAYKTCVSYIPYDTVTDANINAKKIAEIDALVTEEELKEIQLGGGAGYFTINKWWYLRAKHLADTKVTKRGLIVDSDGKQWAVDYCNFKTGKSRWACFCTLIGNS